MRWRKLGRIFTPAGQRPWMQSHCLLPFAEPVDSAIIRVWFTPRDAANRSHAAWLEIDIRRPQDVLRIVDEPVLAPGPPGRFDHTGVGGSCVVRHGDERRLYFIGWSREGPDPYHIAIGLAVAKDGDDVFRLRSDTPVLDRNTADPFMVSTPFVLADGAGWRMWYFSVTDWPDPERPPHYNLRQAISTDGILWKTDARPCVDITHPTEVAIARPTVIRDKDRWRMWFCHRGTDYLYRVGFAESRDGQTWTRCDEKVGIDVSKSGWDTEMIAYPYVFDHGGGRYMLYAGNGYGCDGMGLAVLEQD
jgi:hypothetical protein